MHNKNNVNSYFMIWLIILMTIPARNQSNKGEPQGTTPFSPKIGEKLYFPNFSRTFSYKKNCMEKAN